MGKQKGILFPFSPDRQIEQKLLQTFSSLEFHYEYKPTSVLMHSNSALQQAKSNLSVIKIYVLILINTKFKIISKNHKKLTYKMSSKLGIRFLPTTISFSWCRRTCSFPKAPHQVIHIQHQQVLQVCLLSLPMD